MANTRGSGFVIQTGSKVLQTRTGALVVETLSTTPSGNYVVTLDDALFSGSGKVTPIATFSFSTDSIVFSGSSSAGPPSAIFAVTLADVTFSGSASLASPYGVISGTLADITFSGSSTSSSSGTITTSVLKNNTGTILSSETNATAYIYVPTTGVLVVKKTGLTSNVSGIMIITDPLIVVATQYRVILVLNSGAEGMEKITAT